MDKIGKNVGFCGIVAPHDIELIQYKRVANSLKYVGLVIYFFLHYVPWYERFLL